MIQRFGHFCSVPVPTPQKRDASCGEYRACKPNDRRVKNKLKQTEMRNLVLGHRKMLGLPKSLGYEGGALSGAAILKCWCDRALG